MNAYPNIVWFLIDSIRNYPTDRDLRGKLPVMEEFGRQSVEFTTCVTTAPSTVMSVTAMMTGFPAYFLARNYDDFRFDKRVYVSLSNVLKEWGYASYAFLRGPQTREKFQGLLEPVPRSLWLPHLRHGRKWTNADLNSILDRMLGRGIPRPAFLFFHYNPQTRSETGEIMADPDVSDRVGYAWHTLQEAGFTPDNTIYVMSSDHGFPDPSTGLTSEWEAKNRLTHDLVLTDDNILIPLYFQYPGCTPATIKTPVYSLDIFPTLLELAGIPNARAIEQNIDGTSLVSFIHANAESTYGRRYFRCDSRLMLQTGRSTAIRNQQHKYIRFHDEHRLLATGQPSELSEVLIDLEQDPHEVKNLLLSESPAPEIDDLLTQFRAEFERSEQRALSFHIDYLLARQRDKILSHYDSHADIQVCLAFEPNTAGYAEIGVHAIEDAFPNARIDVLTDAGITQSALSLQIHRTVAYQSVANGDDPLLHIDEDALANEYDLLLLFVQDPAAPVVSSLLDLTRSLNIRRQYVIDCNFNTFRRRRYWYYRLRAFAARIPYFLEEPAFLLVQLRAAGKLIARHTLRPLGLWERWKRADEAGHQPDG